MRSPRRVLMASSYRQRTIAAHAVTAELLAIPTLLGQECGAPKDALRGSRLRPCQCRFVLGKGLEHEIADSVLCGGVGNGPEQREAPALAIH